MTIELVMLPHTRLLVLMVVLLTAGCGTSRNRLVTPAPLPEPYPASKLWAVAPLRNESGTSLADGIHMADQLTQQLQQTQSINVLPVNRVLQAMEANGLDEVTNIADAMALMRTLDLDGLLVGSITAYDPYSPPKLGASLQLYSRRFSPSEVVNPDPRDLARAASDSETRLPGMTNFAQPASQVSHFYDAANHDVLNRLQSYAEGRAAPDSPSGFRGYLLNADQYGEFVAFDLLHRLLSEERARLTTVGPVSPTDANTP